MIDSSQVIKKEINAKLKTLNEKSRDYINDVISLLNKEVGVSEIFSLIIFGSQRSRTDTIVSDCDLLIILKDKVSNKHIKKIEKYFIALELKHGFRELNQKFTCNILGVIQQTTGMFISHFLTKRKYFKNGIFHKIFCVNKVISRLIAPRTIVLSSMIDNSSVLYGVDLRDMVKKKIKIPPLDMIKSSAMNLIISLFSIAISVFKSLDAIKFQLEAVKWALRASNYYSYEDSESLENIIIRFSLYKNPKKQVKAKQFFQEFLQLRKKPLTNLHFMLRCPIRILKIHLKGLIFRKK